MPQPHIYSSTYDTPARPSIDLPARQAGRQVVHPDATTDGPTIVPPD